ncbi:MAG TPA: FHA domain-containing protein [Anaerolineales bacterium]|nr:FHA domain-containing protein [Anaerolineales bacterium]
MSLAPHRGILTLIWILILLLGAVYSPISAQEGSQVRLAPVNTQEFPSITSYLDVRSPQGEFIHGLEQQNVHIIEDGSQIPVQELQHMRTGVQFVLAISPGPAFDIRDVQGVSRYEYLAQALQDWADARQGSTVDDLSIIVADGPESTHETDLNRWAASLGSFNPTGEETGPDFDILTRALDVAADPTSTPGMSSAVLFVTPLPAQDVSLGLQSLAARATQQGVKIFIWLVASAELFSSPEAEQMRFLAEETGGALFAYSGQEPIPSPENFLEALRNTYFLAYDSQISTSGPHQTSAEVTIEGLTITSPEQAFDLEVVPPSITFVSPPMEIERTIVDPESESQSLSPNSQSLELLIEFPDGYSRPIAETTLFVDGVATDVNRIEPFDRFTWDLSEYASNGEHILVVEVEDSLGLTSQSVETSIQVNVGGSDESFFGLISQNRIILAAILVVVSGAILLLVFVLGGRLKPGFLRDRRRKKKQTGPITQPVQINQENSTQSRPSWINRIQWPRGPITTKPYAQFIPITDSNSEDSQPPMAITKGRVVIGKDENIVDQVLTDDSVEGVHAYLERESMDSYRLSDEGSTAGTWVNYLPVSAKGQILQHGDLVHFGRMGFRFILRNPKRVRKPVLRFENTE